MSPQEAPHHVLNSYVDSNDQADVEFVQLPSSTTPRRSVCSVLLFLRAITTKRHPAQLAIHQRTSAYILLIMDREYIQYLKQEAAASATRAISRAVAVSIYGVVGVYLLSTIMSGVLPKVAAILPLGSNAMESQDEGGMDLDLL